MAAATAASSVWGYLPHEDKYQQADHRRRATPRVIMKSGVYDGKSDTHKLMDQAYTREDTRMPGTTNPAARIRSTASPRPSQKNTIDMAGKYSWSTAVRHEENGRLEAGPLARQLVAGGKHGEAWQHYDPLVLDMYKQDGRRQRVAAPLRAHARMHEALSSRPTHALREFRLNDPWYIKPTEKRRPRLGGDRGDPRRAVPLDRRPGRQDQELPDHRPDHLERRPALRRRSARPHRGGADRHADRRSRTIPSRSVMSAAPTIPA